MLKQIWNPWLLTGALVVVCGVPADAQRFIQTNLTTDTGIGGTKKDANLVNPWGLSRASGSPWWTSDNGKDLSTLYIGDGTAQSLVVSVPGGPTGTVFNGTGDFPLNGNPAVFLFATEAGAILGWNGGPTATMVASKANAIYKGLARGSINGKNYLYAADFHHGKIDVLNAQLRYVALQSCQYGTVTPVRFRWTTSA